MGASSDEPIGEPPSAPGGQLTAATLLPLLFTPTRTEPSTDAAAVLASGTVHSDVIEGVRTTHYVWDSGRPQVLLVHGWSGHAGHMAALAEAMVGAGMAVVVADQPGHGHSEGRRSSVIHFTHVIEFAERRYGPFDAIVAHSLGGAAATYALARGMQSAAAVFINPMTSYDSLWLRNIAVFGIPAEVMAETVTRAQEWLGISFDEIAPRVLARDLSTRLLLIHDRNDRESALSDSAALVAAWPDARLVEVENLGHTRVLANEDIVAHVVEFVTAASGSTSGA